MTNVRGDDNVVAGAGGQAAGPGGIAAGGDVRGSIATGGDARELAAEKGVLAEHGDVNQGSGSISRSAGDAVKPKFRLAAALAIISIVVGIVLLVVGVLAPVGLTLILAGVAAAIQAYRLWKGV